MLITPLVIVPPAAAVPVVDTDALESATAAVMEVDPTALGVGVSGSEQSVDQDRLNEGTVTVSDSISVDLPFLDGVQDEAVGVGDAYALAQDEVTTFVTHPAPDSAKVLTVLHSSEAPLTFTYVLSGDSISSLELTPSGGIVAKSPQGEIAALVLPPWATDAEGVDVPTRYRISGSRQFEQVIDHTGGEYAYPIVADPYLGTNLISGWSWSSTWKGQPVIKVIPSSWGRLVMAGAGVGPVPALVGQTIMRTDGWAELLNRQTTANRNELLSKATYKQQWDCHATFGYYPFGGTTWDLERAHPNFSNWFPTIASHGCNWST